MTSYRITTNRPTPICSEDEILESIWLIQKEMRGGLLPKSERIAANRQIATYRAMLDALRSGGA